MVKTLSFHCRGCAGLGRSAVSDFLWTHGLQPARLFCLWGFSRQEYWSGLPCPPPGDLPNPGIKLRCPTLQVDSLLSQPPGKPKNTGVSIPSPGDLPGPGIEPGSPPLQVGSLPAELPGALMLPYQRSKGSSLLLWLFRLSWRVTTSCL